MPEEAPHSPHIPPTELAHAAQEAARTGRRQRIPYGKGYLAVSYLAKEGNKRKSPRRTRQLTRASSLWSVVGAITEASGPTDISANKHKYLTEAYLENHE